eukprot:TRINITY_DN34633_c0_g1_i1.p1 TRINITY_DN34633_c0_g1~~TRINITY_DN34633_c0_g1_i1.p1  ORF type:complete len:990 (+),score=253.19 TRINITY_DN34633_c0_g1_i1:57-2972(+)
MPPKVRSGVNVYAELGVKEDADEATIKKEYRRLVLLWHPDKHAQSQDSRAEAEEKIRAINQAYEILSNPAKRETYDLQRVAVDKRKRGVVPATSKVTPKLAVPKEFMMQPVNYHESFVRVTAKKRVTVQCRRDVKVEFQQFFKGTKFSLWWLPEVNNMCRIRCHGLKARADKKATRAGLAGGMNIEFNVSKTEESGESEVNLGVANKGQKNDKVNFVVKSSPFYEGAYRFETACRRGSYLAYVPSRGLHIVNFLDEHENRVLDFMTVDFTSAIKFQDLEEVLLPATKLEDDAAKSESRGWISVSQLQKDENVRDYFKKVLDKPVWDADDFAIFFKGHWALWEYREEDQHVRLRPPEDKLAQVLKTVSGPRQYAYVIVEAGDELKRLPFTAAADAIRTLAQEPTDEELYAPHKQEAADDGQDGEPPKKRARDAMEQGSAIPENLGNVEDAMEDLQLARSRLIGALADIIAHSQEAEQMALSVQELLLTAEKALVLGGKRPGYDAMVQRKAASCKFAEIAFKHLAAALPSDGSEKPPCSDEELFRLIRLPAAEANHTTLEPLCKAYLQRSMASTDRAALLSKLLREIAASTGCDYLLSSAGKSVLEKLDTFDADDSAEALRVLAEVGAELPAVTSAVRLRGPAIGMQALADVLVSISERPVEKSDLKTIAECLASKAPLTRLKSEVLVALAVAAAKTPSLEVIFQAVSEASALSFEKWSSGDIVKMLLAATKAKRLLSDEIRKALLDKASSSLRVTDLTCDELLKLLLAISGQAPGSPFLEVVADRVVEHAKEFSQAHLLLATQAMVQGLGRAHGTPGRLLAAWPDVLAHAACAAGDSASTPEGGSKQAAPGGAAAVASREAAQGNEQQLLTAEQLCKLLKLFSVDGGAPEKLREAVGLRLLALTGENAVNETACSSVDSMLQNTGPLASFSQRDKLKDSIKAVIAALAAAAAAADSDDENAGAKKKKKKRKR